MNNRDILLYLRKQFTSSWQDAQYELIEAHYNTLGCFTRTNGDYYERICFEIKNWNTPSVENPSDGKYIATTFQMGLTAVQNLINATLPVNDKPLLEKYKATLELNKSSENQTILHYKIGAANVSSKIDSIDNFIQSTLHFYDSKWKPMIEQYNTPKSLYSLLSSQNKTRRLLCQGEEWRALNTMILSYLIHGNNNMDKQEYPTIQTGHANRLKRCFNTINSMLEPHVHKDIRLIALSKNPHFIIKQIEKRNAKKSALNTTTLFDKLTRITSFKFDPTSFDPSDLGTGNNDPKRIRRLWVDNELIEFQQMIPAIDKNETLKLFTTQQTNSINKCVEESQQFIGFRPWEIVLSTSKKHILIYCFEQTGKQFYNFIPMGLFELTTTT